MSRVAMPPQVAFKGKRMVYLSRAVLATVPCRPFPLLPSWPRVSGPTTQGVSYMNPTVHNAKWLPSKLVWIIISPGS